MLTETIQTNLRYLYNKAPHESFTAVDAISFYRFLIDNDGEVDQLFTAWYKTRSNDLTN